MLKLPKTDLALWVKVVLVLVAVWFIATMPGYLTFLVTVAVMKTQTWRKTRAAQSKAKASAAPAASSTPVTT